MTGRGGGGGGDDPRKENPYERRRVKGTVKVAEKENKWAVVLQLRKKKINKIVLVSVVSVFSVLYFYLLTDFALIIFLFGTLFLFEPCFFFYLF